MGLGTRTRGCVSGKCPAPGERGRKSPSTKCWSPSWGRAAQDQHGHQHHVPTLWPGDPTGTGVGNTRWGHVDPIPFTACTLPAPSGAAPWGGHPSPGSQTLCGHWTARGECHQLLDRQTDGQNSHKHDPKSILAPASREPPPRTPARCELHQLGAPSQEGKLGNEPSSSTSEPPRWMSSPAQAPMMRGNLLKATGFQRIPLAGAKPTSRAILARPRPPSGSRRGPPGTAGHGATRKLFL